MLEIRTFSNKWIEVTKEAAENFYIDFCENTTTMDVFDRKDYFNQKHIRGGQVLLNGKVETDEEKSERIFQSYKKDLLNLEKEHGSLRFICIEFMCSFPNINPYEMAASLVRDGIEIKYDDSSISRIENIKKEHRVNKIA